MKKDKKGNLKSALSKRIVFTGIASTVICAISVILPCFFSSSKFHVLIIVGLAVISTFSLALLFFFCYKNIIETSENIELAVQEIEKYNTDNILDLKADKETLTNSLTKILERIKESISREYLIKSLEQRSAYSELQSQINPHFLYNTLESIRGQALCDGNEIVAEMTETLAKYFRYSISKNTNDDLVTLEKELNNARNYIKIQKYRFEDRFDFQIKFRCEESECLDCKIPKMSLQPLVENAVLHGLESRDSCGLIIINVEVTDKRLIIQISDNGNGIDKDTLAKIDARLKNSDTSNHFDTPSSHNGIALTNVNERIKLAFGKEFGLVIASTLNIGTEITIFLPIIK